MQKILVLAACALIAVPQAMASTRIYDVDPEYRVDVLEVLTRMLNPAVAGTPELRGSVSLLPTGQILVDTVTDTRQEEVAAILDAIARAEPGPTPTVTLRYWLLHGVPGQSNASGLPTTLDGVVRELEAVHGQLGVSILAAATVSGRSGESAVFQSDRWEIEQEAYVSGEGDRLNAELVVQSEFQELEVDLALTRGDFVVLGAGSSGQLAEDGVIALIVNWPED